MKRNELRRLEQQTHERFNTPTVCDEIREQARRARPDDDPDELETRLRLALPKLYESTDDGHHLNV